MAVRRSIHQRLLRSILWFFLLSVVIALGIGIWQKVMALQQKEKETAVLPAFTFWTLDGQPFTGKHLKPGQPTVILFFRPGCEFCETELTMFRDRREDFAEANLLFVTAEPPADLLVFLDEQGLNTDAGPLFLHVSPEEMKHDFWVSNVPVTLVYGPDRYLRERFDGETKIEVILKTLAR